MFLQIKGLPVCLETGLEHMNVVALALIMHANSLALSQTRKNTICHTAGLYLPISQENEHHGIHALRYCVSLVALIFLAFGIAVNPPDKALFFHFDDRRLWFFALAKYSQLFTPQRIGACTAA